MSDSHGRVLRAGCVALALVVILAVAAAGATAVPAAADDDEPPVLPASYHGEVTVDGEPVPEGTVVSAAIDGEIRGQVTVEDEGTYGGETFEGDSLIVYGEPDEAGEPVAFLVNGEAVDADPEVEWESGDVRNVDLSGEDIDLEPPADPPSPVPPAPDPADPEFRVTDVALSQTTIGVGETVTVDVAVENVGESGGADQLTLYVDGEEIATETLSLEPGETGSVAFTETFDEAGEYAIEVAGTAGGTLSVVAPSLEVTDAELNETDVAVGEAFETTATVENPGAVAVEESIELLVDGTPVETTTVTLEPGATETVSFTHAVDDEGTFDVAVEGAEAGTVTVEAAEDPDDDGGLAIPGFGAVAALVALLAVAAAATRRPIA